jgi:carbon monoxide dehydrogenase subunit G
MKFTGEITLDLPRERVIELFDSTENLYQWQPGLQSFEPLEGEPGQPGAKSRLVYDENGRQVEMIETIVRREFPDAFAATYEAIGVMNWVANCFVEEDPGHTRWVVDNEFRFSGLMALMGPFMRGAIKKQTLRDMNRFKAFAESA